jgi:CheY-like chemotaxis protein
MNATGSILLVEDNPDDVFFMQRAFKTAGLTNPLQVAEDGQEAIDYLSGSGRFADREAYPDPCLLILDLKLPRKNGHEVLGWLRTQPEFAKLVVIAMTTSREPRDIHEAYRLGVNAYLVKPTSPTQLVEMLKALREFWMGHNIVE